VRVYFDTNVLIAASVQEHPQHVQSFDLVKAVKEGALRGCISTHGLAEFYSVLTRAPFTPRTSTGAARGVAGRAQSPSLPPAPPTIWQC
jgi:predicted nucleic acid-binding protein